jgi:hypothetical protein
MDFYLRHGKHLLSSSCLSVCPPVRMYQLGSCRTVSVKPDIGDFLWKFVDQLEICLKSNTSNEDLSVFVLLAAKCVAQQ